MKTRASGIRRCLVLTSVYLVVTMMNHAFGSDVEIEGTATFPEDVKTVQAALDNPMYEKVILSGTFDFGQRGVQMNRPNVTLEGSATILGGEVAVEVVSPNTNVTNLTFEGPHIAISVNLDENGSGHVDLADNVVTNCSVGIAAFPQAEVPDGTVSLEVHGNVISDCDYGFFATNGSPYSYLTKIHNNRIETITYDGVRIWTVAAPLDIVDNKITGAALDAIWIGSWDVSGMEDPEYGDNPPVNIIGNTIDINDAVDENGLVIYGSAGIMVGVSSHGINNVLVKDNVLRGVSGYGGLTKQPYGHDNRFIDNDLSGLISYGPQILLFGGRDNLFLKNKLGETRDWGINWVSAELTETTAATISTTANWHLDVETPDPVNSGNEFIANDYTGTGLPGWDDGAGAVLLTNFIEKWYYDSENNTFESFIEEMTTENTVIELGKFPKVNGKKTNVCNQVLDMSNLDPDDGIPGSNDVTGWSSCE